MSLLSDFYSYIAKNFYTLSDFPTFYILDTIAVTNEILLHQFFNFSPWRCLPLIIVIMYFPFIFDYTFNRQNKFTDYRYIITILILWFYIFFINPTFIVQHCFYFPRVYYFLVGMSMCKSGLRYYKFVKSRTKSNILSLFVGSIVFSCRDLLLYGVTLYYIPDEKINPLPIFLFSLLMIFLYMVLIYTNKDTNWIFFFCLISGWFLQYRFIVGNTHLVNMILGWFNKII